MKHEPNIFNKSSNNYWFHTRYLRSNRKTAIINKTVLLLMKRYSVGPSYRAIILPCLFPCGARLGWGQAHGPGSPWACPANIGTHGSDPSPWGPMGWTRAEANGKGGQTSVSYVEGLGHHLVESDWCLSAPLCTYRQNVCTDFDIFVIHLHTFAMHTPYTMCTTCTIWTCKGESTMFT